MLCSADISSAATLGQILFGKKSSAKTSQTKTTQAQPSEELVQPKKGQMFTFVGIGSVNTTPIPPDGTREAVYEISRSKSELEFSFIVKDAKKNATRQFLQCIDNGKYAGPIAITTKFHCCPVKHLSLTS